MIDLFAVAFTAVVVALIAAHVRINFLQRTLDELRPDYGNLEYRVTVLESNERIRVEHEERLKQVYRGSK